jgi:Holliday junction resolvasome RuvABC DNA-binding subunit
MPFPVRWCAPPNPQSIDEAQRAFSALRNLGFKDGEVKRALAEVRAHVGAGIEELIRAALGVLTA